MLENQGGKREKEKGIIRCVIRKDKEAYNNMFILERKYKAKLAEFNEFCNTKENRNPIRKSRTIRYAAITHSCKKVSLGMNSALHTIINASNNDISMSSA